jgi:hypothetical protein
MIVPEFFAKRFVALSQHSAADVAIAEPDETLANKTSRRCE